MQLNLHIFTDGGSRGNPGPAAIGVFALNSDGGERLYAFGECLGIKTNNEAEYQAFLHSVKWALKYQSENAIDSITWQLDSKLVVEQLNKKWKIKEDRLRLIAQEVWGELAKISAPYSIRHIPRELNHEADALVNQALDAAGSPQS